MTVPTLATQGPAAASPSRRTWAAPTVRRLAASEAELNPDINGDLEGTS